MKLKLVKFNSETELNETTVNLPSGTYMNYEPNDDKGTNSIVMSETYLEDFEDMFVGGYEIEDYKV